jgi:hypothetical protein
MKYTLGRGIAGALSVGLVISAVGPTSAAQAGDTHSSRPGSSASREMHRSASGSSLASSASEHTVVDPDAPEPVAPTGADAGRREVPSRSKEQRPPRGWGLTTANKAARANLTRGDADAAIDRVKRAPAGTFLALLPGQTTEDGHIAFVERTPQGAMIIPSIGDPVTVTDVDNAQQWALAKNRVSLLRESNLLVAASNEAVLQHYRTARRPISVKGAMKLLENSIPNRGLITLYTHDGRDTLTGIRYILKRKDQSVDIMTDREKVGSVDNIRSEADWRRALERSGLDRMATGPVFVKYKDRIPTPREKYLALLGWLAISSLVSIVT